MNFLDPPFSTVPFHLFSPRVSHIREALPTVIPAREGPLHLRANSSLSTAAAAVEGYTHDKSPGKTRLCAVLLVSACAMNCGDSQFRIYTVSRGWIARRRRPVERQENHVPALLCPSPSFGEFPRDGWLDLATERVIVPRYSQKIS